MHHASSPPRRRPPRLRESFDALRARSGRWRERLTPKRVHAPSLDWLNFLVADVRGALGPFVVVYLASEAHWDAATVGLVTSIGGWIGLSAQTPIGAWLDRTPHKRGLLITALVLLSVGAVMVAWWPRFWPVLAANSLMQVVSGVFEPAIAALTLGLCTRETLTRRMGRNAAWSRAGNIVVAVTSGLLAWLVSAEAV
ncbi:MAG: MFS transporter, partial [Rhodospirillales bacterium]|nr:MFS transporter [Rhodospirillales bacterium]